MENYFFLENYVTRERISRNVLYYQQLSIARYQVSFYADNYFLVTSHSVIRALGKLQQHSVGCFLEWLYVRTQQLWITLQLRMKGAI